MQKQATAKAGSAAEDVRKWSVPKLKEFLTQHRIDFAGVLEKSGLVELVVAALDDELLAGASGAPPAAAAPVELPTGDLSAVPTAELAQKVPANAHAAYFRQNPARLGDVLADLFRAEKLSFHSRPKVAKWLTVVANGADRGQAMLRALATPCQAVCGRQLNKADVAFKCITCGADPTCIMCVDCFKRSPCQHHEYRMLKSGGGMCDCGDPTAWKKESFCSQHRGLSDDDDPTVSIPPADRPWTFAVLRGSLHLVARICDFMVKEEQVPEGSELEALLGETAVMVQALVDHGDCAKRVICQLLCEDLGTVQRCGGVEGFARPTPLPAGTAAGKTVLDSIFFFDYHIVSSHVKRWSSVAKVICSIVSDPCVKDDICRLVVKYSERSVLAGMRAKTEAAAERKLMSLSVQVLTVPPVVEALLLPQRLRLDSDSSGSCATTIIHRLVSGLMFAVTQTATSESKKAVAAELDKEQTRTSDRMAALALQFGSSASDEDKVWVTVLQKCYDLKYALKASARARNFFLTTRTVQLGLLRTVLLATEGSGAISRNSDAVVDSNPAIDIESCYSKILFSSHDDLRRLVRWLRAGKPRSDCAAGGSASASIVDFPRGLELLSRVKSMRFPPVADTSLAAPLLSKLISLCAVDAGRDGSFLPPDIQPDAAGAASAQQGDAAAVDFIANVIEPMLLLAIAVCRRTVASSSPVVLASTTAVANLLSADILDDKERRPVTFSSPIMRSVALAVKAFLSETPQPSSVQSLLSRIGRLCDAPGAVEALFDRVVMRSVLEAQVAEDLWKRNFMNVLQSVQIHQRFNNFYFRETDIFSVQLLVALCGSPHESLDAIPSIQDLAHQWLARFSFQPAPNRLDKAIAPVGYSYFLRHVLTAVFDASKSMAPGCSSYEALRYATVHILASGMRTRSQIVEKLKAHIDDEDDAESFEEQLSRCLAEVATVTVRKEGNVYTLNDDAPAAWQRVTPYHVNFTDDDTSSAGNRWLVMMTKSKKKQPALLVLPFASLPATHHHEALVPSLLALLHTDAVISTAAFAVQCRALKLRQQAAPASADAAEAQLKKTRHEEADPAGVPDVTDDYVDHSITALFALAQHAARITAESAETLARDGAAADAAALRAFQAQHVRCTSYAAESLQKLLPCAITAAEAQPSLLKDLLQPVTSLNLRLLSRSALPLEAAKALSTIDAVRVLRDNARDARDSKLKAWRAQNKQPGAEEPLLIAETSEVNAMTYILQVLGGESMDAGAGEAEPSAEENQQAASQAERDRKIKEKQRLLMERMKKKQDRASANFAPSATPASASAAATTDDDGISSTCESTSTAGTPTSLHAALMLHCAELECCFCQMGDDDPAEPLLWLTHATTSNVVALLKPHVTAGSTVHGHVHMCGHAAHAKCIHRHHHKIGTMRGDDIRQLLMSGRGFRGIMYLGPAEFLCPMCARVVSSVSLVPKLWTARPAASSSLGELTSTLGSLLQRWLRPQDGGGRESDSSADSTPQQSTTDFTVDAGYLREWTSCMVQSAKVLTAAADFQHATLNAAIGLSINSDGGALVPVGNLGVAEQAAETFIRSCEVVAATVTCIVENALCGAKPHWRDYATVVSSILSLSVFPSRKELDAVFELVLLRLAQQEAEPFHSITSLAATIARCIASLHDSSISLHHVAAQGMAKHLARLPQPTSSMNVWRELAPFTLVKIAMLGEATPDIAAIDVKSATSQEIQLVFLALPTTAAWNFDDMCRPLRSYLLDTAWLEAPPAEPLTMPQWQTQLLTTVMHLPTRYDHIVMQYADASSRCALCGGQPSKPVMCLTCGKVLCLQRSSAPELFAHARSCGKGIGTFVLIKATSFLVIDAVHMRAMQPHSVYVDRYGERDESLHRGVSLSLSPVFSAELLRLFVSCGWDTDTALLRSAWKHGVADL